MIIQLEIAPGVSFITTTQFMGLSDEAARAMQGKPVTDNSVGFVWHQVRAASDRLFHTTPHGNC